MGYYCDGTQYDINMFCHVPSGVTYTFAYRELHLSYHIYALHIESYGRPQTPAVGLSGRTLLG